VKSRLFIFIIILFMTAALTNCIKQKQQGLTITEGILSIGVEVGYPPMEYMDIDSATLIGFDIELAKALSGKLGLSADFIDTSWEGIFAGLDSGKYDIALNITILPERQQKFNFTKPYINSFITIVTLNNSSVSISEAQDIAGFRIGYQGDTTAQYFAQRLKEQGVVFSSFAYDKIIHCFNDLQIGRIDLVIVDNIAASHYTEKEASNFKIIWEGMDAEHIGICLKKGNDALTNALNNALYELFQDGTMQELSFKIFSRDLVSSVRNF